MVTVILDTIYRTNFSRADGQG